ncbi:MAG: DNA-protecting protein DprA [Candidatus Levyibacteriota bacterium]|nr:MAG: DNA-protecting protein DprA [Candidatus Levybacteria bacterium]
MASQKCYDKYVEYQEIDNWEKVSELKKLLDLSTKPKHLYYIGNLDPQIFKHCAAIVGSRKMTSYGQTVVEKMAPRLISQNITIVSGFMYGVDQYAHRVCVESGGKTIAVFGWGINTKLTGNDLKLAKDIIASGGLLLSEWEEQKASHWTFPVRNRIVAALSDAVYVVEAALHSGSLITARLALKLKKELFAVPGPITSRTSFGTNKLIADGKAKVWLGQDAINILQSVIDDPMLQILDNEALSADELALKLNVPISKIGAKLSMFLLSGQLNEKGGKYYINYVS